MYHVVHIYVPCGTSRGNLKRRERQDRERLADHCLAAFIQAGSLDASLEQLASIVGTSKRMLIHYFGSREALEEMAMVRLEERLRERFRVETLPANTSAHAAVMRLWEQSTAPESRGTLLLIMDLSRRAWRGSARGRAFYAEQQRLWVQLLSNFLPDPASVEEFLQLFQGALLAYLVTGDRDLGRRALERMLMRNLERSIWRDRSD